jgi:hypothetical protein
MLNSYSLLNDKGSEACFNITDSVFSVYPKLSKGIYLAKL